MKVSDYLADFLVKHNISNVFTVVGGGAMHMNDSFGHDKRLKCTYNHHEQASAMAAEAFYRVNNEMAAVCVTSGPGAINALNGVCGAYQDSIPMLVFSGQVKSTLTVKSSGLNLRTLGGQEFNIISAVSEMTKFSVMIEDPNDIRYYLEKAYYIAISGRPGPCWLDIPLDIQGANVDVDSLKGYEPSADEVTLKDISDDVLLVAKKLKESKRPVFYAGNGIRISGCVEKFRELINKTGIPTVTCWDSIDLIETDNDNYTGRGGTMGDRAGNFAVQNSDFLLCVGSRLSIYQVGYNLNSWAREAFVVDVDIDPEEMKKPTIRVDLPVCSDAGVFIDELYRIIEKDDFKVNDSWRNRCLSWKNTYPVVNSAHYNDKELTNVYAFIDSLSRRIPNNSVTVVANGSASVVGSQTYYIGEKQRFIMNCSISSMGYELPAAIGAAKAVKDEMVICVGGDGSLQMNIQELQTIVTNKLPIKMFIINNGGYHQIRQTQNNIFHNGLVGVGPESGDLGFPDLEKIAYAYNIPFVRIKDNSELADKIDEVIDSDSYCLCEVVCSVTQKFEPKSMTRKLPDGRLVSPPLEDMAPFLDRDELKANMIIPLWNE